jgi:fluoride exporter
VKIILLIALGGASGAVCRYMLSMFISTWAEKLSFVFLPATLVVNILGCFFMGLVWGLFFTKFSSDDIVKYFISIGFLGSFTTFSTFTMETFLYWQKGQLAFLCFNILGSVCIGMLALVLGYYISQLYAN